MLKKKIKVVAAPVSALEYIRQQIEYKQAHIRNEKRRLEYLLMIQQELSRTAVSSGNLKK